MSATAKRTTQRRTATKAASKQEVFLDFEQLTKGGVYRFKEPVTKGERPMLGTIWVRPDVAEKLGLDKAEAVKVTLEADTE